MPTLARDYDYHFKEFNGVPVNPPSNLSLYSTQTDKSSLRTSSSTRNRSTSRSKGLKTTASSSDGDNDDDDGDHDEDDGDRHEYQVRSESNSQVEENENDQTIEESKPVEEDADATPCENWRGSRFSHLSNFLSSF